MVDRVEAKKNIDFLTAEIEKWQGLSRGLMTRDEMIMVDTKIQDFKRRIHNARQSLLK